MTLSEALAEGTQVAVVGLTIVFSVLIILMVVLMLMKVIFYKPEQPVKKEEATPAPTPVVQTQSEMDEEELIAVLTAAVAASLNTSTYNLNIQSYRKIGGAAPAWNQAGRRDVIDARF